MLRQILGQRLLQLSDFQLGHLLGPRCDQGILFNVGRHASRGLASNKDLPGATPASSTETKNATSSKQSGGKAPKQQSAPGKQTSSKSGGKQATAKTGVASVTDKQRTAVNLVEQLGLQHRRCRLEEYYKTILTRELLVKLNLSNPLQVPAVERVELSILAKDVLGRPAGEKHEMLVYGLGLEHVSGLRPVYVVGANNQGGNKQEAGGNVPEVKVTLTGSRMYDFLEKLMLLVMPAQLGFTGVRAGSVTASGRLSFRLDSLLNYPDFEDVYELFSQLRSMHITLQLRNCRTQAHAALLLSGLSFPVRGLEKLEAAVPTTPPPLPAQKAVAA